MATINIDGGLVTQSRPYIKFRNVSGVASHISLTPQERVISLPVSPTNSTVDDARMQHSVGSTSVIDYLISVDFVDGKAIAVSVSDGALLSGGLVKYTANAEVTVMVHVDGILSETKHLSMQSATASSVDQFLGWVVDSPADVIHSYLSGLRLTGASDTTRLLFSKQDHAAKEYERNSSSWLASRVSALTCASPWNSAGTTQRAGTAVTPRHILQAQHFPLTPGTIVRFVTAANVLIERVITSVSVVSSVSPPWQSTPQPTDIQVAQLDADLPASITPAKLLFWASDVSSAPALPTLSKPTARRGYPGMGVHVVGLDQEEKANLYFMTSMAPSVVVTAPSGDFGSFSDQVIGGDSGNPIFMFHPDESAAILLAGWTTGGFGGSGPSYGYYRSAIQATIDSLCAGVGLSSSAYQIATCTF